MSPDQIERMQLRVGAKPDGDWGPLSQLACRRHLQGMMPKTSPWPTSDQKSLISFYGQPGDESNLVMIDFPYPMFYGGKRVTRTRVHKRCAESLLRVLTEIRGIIKEQPEHQDEAEDYGGVFNFRKKRLGSSWSLHAFGAAIDLDADDNTMQDAWPVVADMPLEIMEAFAREGWVSAGAFWGYDAMHNEATALRLHY